MGLKPAGSTRILIAGVGNIFLGDDGFGVEVAQRLMARGGLPAGVSVHDFGIRGLDLAFTLLDDYDAAVLVDAVSRGGNPGTLYVIEPERSEAAPSDAGGSMIDTHHMDPLRVLRFAAALGERVRRIILVGCETGPLSSSDDIQAGLTPPVQAAVDPALALIDALVDRLRGQEAEGVADRLAALQGAPAD